jgi:hypothetical protein
MPIIRTTLKHEDNFTQIPNEWLRDSRLTLKAIGLLAQLLSHSQGWSVSIETLAKANNCGKDLIRSAVTELESAGYLVRKQARNGNLFGEVIYYTSSPADSPLSGFPLSGFPMSENPTPKKNIVKKNIEKKVNAQNEFEIFWDLYPRKIGKGAALKSFLRALESEGWEKIHAGTQRLSQDSNLPDTQFIPYPATWLNREGWNDDPYPERKLTKEQEAERATKQAAERRERDRQKSLEEIAQMEQFAKDSAPIPLCPHGERLVFCRTCLQKGANSA